LQAHLVIDLPFSSLLLENVFATLAFASLFGRSPQQPGSFELFNYQTIIDVKKFCLLQRFNHAFDVVVIKFTFISGLKNLLYSFQFPFEPFFCGSIQHLVARAGSVRSPKTKDKFQSNIAKGSLQS
jgi:hypothetical protein